MINRIEHSTLDTLLPLFDQYMVFYGNPSNPTHQREYLSERLKNAEAIVYGAYTADGDLVGFALNYLSFSSVSMGRIVVLNDLFVTEGARRSGFGGQLIKRVFQLAKELDAVRVDLMTAKDNLKAQTLYEAIGFVKETEFFAYNYRIH